MRFNWWNVQERRWVFLGATSLHLIENHNLTSKNDFENNYKLFLLETCSPKNLEVNEHKFIHKLNTLKPHGLNAVDPFGIPLLNL